MKKTGSDALSRRRVPRNGHVRKATSQKKPRVGSAGLAPARTGVTATPADFLPEHCPAPETVSVHLTFYQPQARQVFVAGSFNNWQPRATPLRPLPGGAWAVDLMLKPGQYEYRYVVDGQWIDDPMAARFVPNPFGNLNSVMEVQPPG